MADVSFDELRALGHVAAAAVMPPTQAQMLDLASRVEEALSGNIVKRKWERSDLSMWVEAVHTPNGLAHPAMQPRVRDARAGKSGTAFGRWLHDLAATKASDPSTTAGGLTLERQAARAFVEAVTLAGPIAADEAEPPYRADDAYLTAMVDKLAGAWSHIVALNAGQEISQAATWWWQLRGTPQWPTVTWLEQHPAVVYYSARAYPDWFPQWWKSATAPPPTASPVATGSVSSGDSYASGWPSTGTTYGGGPIKNDRAWYHSYKAAPNAVDYVWFKF